MLENKKVLIVDEEEEVRLYLANIVEHLFPDLHIILAGTSNEAMYLIKKECVDIILLDVEIPGISGLEIVDKLRKQQIMIQVIFISANKQAELIQKALRLNAVDYIDKPVNPIELDKALRKALLMNNGILINFTDPVTHIFNRIRLNTVKGIMFFEPNEILLFKSSKRDSNAVFKDGQTTLLIRENLSALSKILPVNIFVHANRQYIINLNYVKGVIKCSRSITLSVNNQTIRPVFKDVLLKLTHEYNLYKNEFVE